MGIFPLLLIGGMVTFKTYVSAAKEAMLRHNEIDTALYIADQTSHILSFPNIPYCTVGNYLTVRDLANNVLINNSQTTIFNGLKLRAHCTHKENGEFIVEAQHVDSTGDPLKMPLSGKVSTWSDINNGIPFVKEKCAKSQLNGKTFRACPGDWTFAQAAGKCPELGMVFKQLNTEAENTVITGAALGKFGCPTGMPWSGYWVNNPKPGAGATWPGSRRVYHHLEPTNDGPSIQILRYCDDPYGWNDLDSNWPNGVVCESN